MRAEVTETSVYGEMDTVLEWQKAAGSRAKRFREFISSGDSKINIAIWGVCKECHRLLTLSYLKMSHSVRMPGEESNVAVLATDRDSPIHRALSFYSSLLQGMSNRLHMLVGFRGCSSIRDWFDRCPGDVERLEKMASGSAAVIERRQRRRLNQYPSAFFAALHVDMGQGESLDCFARFVATPYHKVGVYYHHLLFMFFHFYGPVLFLGPAFVSHRI